MSHTIFYKSMFVKTERGFIPMLSMGSNNTYEALNPKKRVRDWTNAHLDDKSDKKLFSREEILAILDGWNGEYQRKRQANLETRGYDSSFGDIQGMAVAGKHPWNTTFNDVKGMVMSGADNAVSLPDAIRNCGLHFSYNESEEFELSSWKRIHPTTEEDFWKTFDELTKSGADFWLHYGNCRADRIADYKDALRLLISKRGRSKCSSNKPYIMITQPNSQDRRYVSIKDGELVLTDRIEEAHVFSKQYAGGKDAADIIYNFFPEVNSIRFDYNIAA